MPAATPPLDCAPLTAVVVTVRADVADRVRLPPTPTPPAADGIPLAGLTSAAPSSTSARLVAGTMFRAMDAPMPNLLPAAPVPAGSAVAV
jgi:hypothetical protein